MASSCGDDTGCQSAVESQFDACFDASGYARYMEVEGFDAREAYMQEAIYDIFECFEDDAGEPIFHIRREA